MSVRSSHRGTPLSVTRWQEGRWCEGVGGPRFFLLLAIPESLIKRAPGPEYFLNNYHLSVTRESRGYT